MSSSYNVEFSKAAFKTLSKLDVSTARRIVKAIEELKNAPFGNAQTRKMHGYNGDLYRLRVGDYRIIYEIQNHKLLIIIVKIGSRGDVYK
ncbi:type II toxin-antitoxin system RelE family toxin [Paenibacillus sanguinis]|uniref:type II toxin-antitoxin system RelE family toxin n=1 Tax=Paenibacillus sanguinis TaxID=225906 RepID=UPI00035EE76A|nr:type II toxin-antitoxin system RelE/ParE family toxin [Paenibacillus sanguinis]